MVRLTKADWDRLRGQGEWVAKERPTAPAKPRAKRRANPESASKYKNVRATVDGIKFASKREASRYVVLKHLQASGKIRNLRRQVVYNLNAHGGKVVAKYIADFTYEELQAGQWEPIVEDVKGMRTRMYTMKKKWLKLQYEITIREV